MKQILSIQSTVTIGFVGNTVAGPVIIHHGHQPLIVNSVTLAAHPGHGLIAGGKLPIKAFDAILDALHHLDWLPKIGTVITGYLGAPSQVKSIAKMIKKWRDARPNSYYILDPVLGDNGRIYVDDKLVKAIRDDLLPLANFVTPNQFELELLTGKAIFDVASSDVAAKLLLNKYQNLECVIITGVNGKSGNVIDRMVSHSEVINLAYKKRPTGVAGGGDLLTAIFASWLAAEQNYKDCFVFASKQAHSIIDQSSNSIEIELLKSIHLLKPIPDR